MGDGGTEHNEDVYVRTSCDGYNVVFIVGVDYSVHYLYDAQSGQLVGIGSSFQQCVAGRGPAQPPSVHCGEGAMTPVCGPSAAP